MKKIIFILIIICISNVKADDKIGEAFYWVNGSGVWSDYFNHWSDSSGGPVKNFGKVPDAGDTVYVDDNSFIDGEEILTIELDENAECLTLDFSQATKKVVFIKNVSKSLKIYGSLHLNSLMDFNVEGKILFEALDPGKIIEPQGQHLPDIILNGTGGWELKGSLDCNDFTMQNGSFNTRGNSLSTRKFDAYGLINELNISNSEIRIRKDDRYSSAFRIYQKLENFNSENSEIKIEMLGHVRQFYSGSNEFHNVTFEDSIGIGYLLGGKYNKVVFNSNGHLYSNGNEEIDCIYDTLVFTPGKIYQLQSDITFNVNELFDARGNTCFPIFIKSSSNEEQTIIFKESGDVICDFLSITDINATGGANFYAGDYTKAIGNNNSGWIYSNAPGYIYGFGADTVLCEGDVINTFNFNGGKSYLWHDGSTEPYHEVDKSGEYWVAVTYGDNCVYRDTINIEIVSNALVDAGEDIYVCSKNTQKEVNVEIKKGIEPYEIFWEPIANVTDPKSRNVFISSDKSQEFVVSVLSPNGCYARDTIWYYIIEDIKPNITKKGLYLESNYEFGNQWMLNGEYIEGAIEQIYYPTKNGVYSVVIIGEGGCRSMASEEINVNFDEIDNSILLLENIKGFPGDEIDLNIKIENKEYMQQNNITHLDFDLEYNPTMLYNDNYDFEVKTEILGLLKLRNIPVNYDNNTSLIALKFIVGLGNAESCDLLLSNAETIGGDAEIDLINGRFNLLGVCYEGGARLISPSSESGITSISPNPTDGEIEIGLNLIEKGYTTLTIYNTMGEKMNSIISENIEITGEQTINLDISKYSSGLYFIVLQTPSHHFTEEVMILK